ncbi:MAG TPA: right-handed parallel beta-helix repeat-containing protein [bacterium]|nr:right-handed parallel beta-helix repeat-containing protein [bacterium]
MEGEDSVSTILNTEKYSLNDSAVFIITGDSVIIKGLTFKNGKYNVEAKYADDLIFENCIFKSETSGGPVWGGVFLAGSSGGRMTGCEILNTGEFGIKFVNTRHFVFANNTIITHQRGLFFDNCDSVFVSNNYIKFNSLTGVDINKSRKCMFLNNTILSSVGSGFSLKDNSTENIFINNEVAFNNSQPIIIDAGSVSNFFSKNNFYRNKYPSSFIYENQSLIEDIAEDLKIPLTSADTGFINLSCEYGFCPDYDLNLDGISDAGETIYYIGYFGKKNPFEKPVNNLPSVPSVQFASSKISIDGIERSYDSIPLFKWNFQDIDGDTQADFHLQISSDKNFNSAYYDAARIGFDIFEYKIPEYAALSTEGVYYYRIRTNDNRYNDDRGWSGFSPVGTFEFIINTPPVVSILTGDTFTDLKNGFTVQAASSDSENNIVRYEWSCINNNNIRFFSDSVLCPEIEFLHSGRFVLQVKAFDSYGEYSVDSITINYYPEYHAVLQPDTFFELSNTGYDTFVVGIRIDHISETVHIKYPVEDGVNSVAGYWNISMIAKDTGGWLELKNLNQSDYSSKIWNISNYHSTGSTVFEIEYYDKNGVSTEIDNSILSGISIEFAYNDTFVLTAGSDQNYAIFYFNENDSLWYKESGAVIDRTAKTITLKPSHFSIRGIFTPDTSSAPFAPQNEIVAYPNPYVPNDGNYRNGKPYDGSAGSGIYFGGLIPNTEIEIYSVSGSRVFKTKYLSGNNGYFQWDVRNDNGRELASGVYLAVFKNSAGKKVKKLAVIK